MFIYFFKSALFEGQTRKVISSWPIKPAILETMVNADNNYNDVNRWKLIGAV